MLSPLSDNEILKEYNLKEMIRYNHRMHIQKESVAAHSFFVALFCLKIMDELQLSLSTQKKVLVKAILHDVSESYMSDIPYDVKRDNREIVALLCKIEESYYEKHWQGYLFDVIYSDEVVNIIVKLADTYSVQQYCLSEIQLGNKTEEISNILEDAKIRVANYISALNKISKIQK